MKEVLLYTFVMFLGINTYATTLIVSNINDSGLGSLRSQIGAANNGDTIRFSPNLISGGNATLILTSGEIEFNKSLIIKGVFNSTDTLFISGNYDSRIFAISYASNLVLDSLILIEGNSIGAASLGNFGGAVHFVGDSLTIINSIVRGNVGWFGGGIYSEANLMIVENTSINGNLAKISNGGGGGIYFEGKTDSSSLKIYNSEIINNISQASGGGVFAQALGGKSPATLVDLRNSTISGNQTSYNGAGIFAQDYSDVPSLPANVTVSLDNSTVSKNISNGSGGGIYIFSFSTTSALASATVKVINSTISGNTASTSGGGIFSKSISSGATSSSVNSVSSIIALNGTDNINSNGASSVISQGFNIFNYSPTGTLNSDQINIDSTQLNLLPLANNGGFTKTMLPGSGSVAINNGNPNDMSNAQNGSIYCGIRDVGSASIKIYTHVIDTTIDLGTSITVGASTYDEDGIYFDTLINTNGCDSVIKLVLSIATGINPVSNNLISIFPNPSHSIITVFSENEPLSKICILDLQGKELQVLSNLNTFKKQIDISRLDVGIYFVQITNKNEENSVLKIVKME